MDIDTLTDRAMALRERFAALDLRNGGRPWTREEVMQGFVGDVGDLMKVVMAKGGLRDVPDADSRLAHELADCLWSVLVLARLYEVDLGRAFETMVEETTLRIDRR